MSGWMSWFGGRQDPKASTREAIVTLRQQLQMLEKKEDHLMKKIDEEQKKAKTNAISNKPGEELLSCGGERGRARPDAGSLSCWKMTGGGLERYTTQAPYRCAMVDRTLRGGWRMYWRSCGSTDDPRHAHHTNVQVG